MHFAIIIFFNESSLFKSYELEEKTKNQSSWELNYVSCC